MRKGGDEGWKGCGVGVGDKQEDGLFLKKTHAHNNIRNFNAHK